VSWDQRFDDPITLPGRKPLFTLRDAATYITELPKAEQDAPAWQTAAELLMIAERGGDTMMARIAMLKALHHRAPEPVTTPRRKRLKSYNIIR
jgi:hypothetical protein